MDKEEVKKEEPEWGEAVDGVQVRLRPAKAQWDPGETTKFILDMRNRGEHFHKAYREPLYCEIELDGQWYLCSSPEDYSRRVIQWLRSRQADRRLGACISHQRHLGSQDAWPKTGRPVSQRRVRKRTVLPSCAGKHTLRIAFVFEDGIRPVSQVAEFEVGVESAWGEAVDGVQARIRTPKVVWIAGEEPTFSYDLRNRGKKTPDQRRAPVDCQFEVDKVWYSYEIPSGPYVAVGYPLKPGEQVNDWTTVTPDENWVSLTPEKKRFPLPPGKHTIRIGYQLQGTTPAIRPISGPIEIEVSEKAAKEATEGSPGPLPKEAAPCQR